MSTTKNKTAIVAFRTHQDIKDRVSKVLAKSGLDTSTVLNMVMQNIALSGKSPVTLDREMSPKLVKIINAVEKEDRSKRKSFISAKDAVAFLNTI
jgi:addiction module RelB/DinJ family antitoxin